MKLEKKMSRICKQAAVLRYVRNEYQRLVPLPWGQRLDPRQPVALTIDQN